MFATCSAEKNQQNISAKIYTEPKMRHAAIVMGHSTEANVITNLDSNVKSIGNEKRNAITQ